MVVAAVAVSISVVVAPKVAPSTDVTDPFQVITAKTKAFFVVLSTIVISNTDVAAAAFFGVVVAIYGLFGVVRTPAWI